MRLFVWQSTRVQVINQTIDQAGDVCEAVRDEPGSVSWNSTSGSLLTPLGAWPVIVKSGGRYDPSPVKQSSECLLVVFFGAAIKRLPEYSTQLATNTWTSVAAVEDESTDSSKDQSEAKIET